MAKPEQAPPIDFQIRKAMGEIKADAINIAKELDPSSPQMVAVRLLSEQRDQRLAEKGKREIIQHAPSILARLAEVIDYHLNPIDPLLYE